MVKELLEKKGMTMYRLAKETGLSHTAIRKVCNGEVSIEKCSGETLYKVAKVLGVSIESLIESKMG